MQEQETNTVPFELISAVRAALATAKIPALLETVEQYEDAEEPVVVFSAHQAPVEALGTREGWAMIYGQTPASAREATVQAFQAGQLKGVACTIKAAGVGITLTRANTLVFVDEEWTPALNEQAEDRICRIGQKRGCNIVRLVADHTMDRRVAELLARKQELVDATTTAAQGDYEARSAKLAKLAEAAEEAPAPAPAKGDPTEAHTGRFAGLVATFRAVKLKFPKLTFQAEQGIVQISLCGSASRYAGQLRVTDGSKYGSGGDYYGQIEQDGTPNARLLKAPEHVLAALDALTEDPAAAVRVNGKETGNCCCCGALLTNETSVANGIGPICAQKWGF